MKGIGMKNTDDLTTWMSRKMAQIFLWLEGGTRSPEDLRSVEEAIQAVIQDKPSKLVLLDSRGEEIRENKSLRYLATSINPMDIREAWEGLYAKWKIPYLVPPVTFDIERIKQESNRGRNRILIYLAPELAGLSGLVVLGKLFFHQDTEKHYYSLKHLRDNKIWIGEQSGWLFVERSLNVPNCNTTESELRKILTSQNAIGMSRNTHVIFGLFCWEIFGEYPDSGGYGRLLESTCKDQVIGVGHGGAGHVSIYYNLTKTTRRSDLGGRSVKEK